MQYDVIVYHDADFDGVCSAAIALAHSPKAYLYGWDYGKMFEHEVVKGKKVLMCDISFNEMKHNIELGDLCDLTIIEHHDRFFKALKKVEKATFEVFGDKKGRYAACELTWKFLFPGEVLPDAISMLSAYDVWDLQRSPRVMPFQFGMRTLEDVYNPRAKVWANVINGDKGWLKAIVARGENALSYIKIANEQALKKYGFRAKLGKYNCAILNTSAFNSQVFDSLKHRDKYDILCCMIKRESGWKVSLYADADKDIDVGAIAEKYGGGGHKGAAGFIIEVLPFDNTNDLH